jgi:phosphate:Na+ symporter
MTEALARLSGNRFVGCLAGCVVTMILSSSSAASVIVITFVESGLLTFQQCLGVLLGVNIGTTLTGHLVAVKLTRYAWHMVAAGFFAVFFSKSKPAQQKAEIAHGLGLLFVGMEVMSNSMAPLQTYPPFRDMLASMEDVPLGIAAACVFTVLIQSSSAATGVIITVSQQGLLSPKAGLALMLGANIGTCGTACVAAIGKKKETVQVALAYLLFKLIGVSLTVAMMQPFTDAVIDRTVPSDLVGALRDGHSNETALGRSVPKFLANSHTVFNVLLAALLLPFTSQLADFVEGGVARLPGSTGPVATKASKQQ